MFSFLKRRWFLAAIGLLLIALFIWYAGPYFAFADWRPLESENARLIAIALVVGCWLLSRVLRQLRANRASDRLVAAVVQQAEKEPRPTAEALQLRERFEEAVAVLKQKRRGGHSLYDLPWYVIIGAPGSGKTTALVNSGLNFPLEQRTGKGALRGVGGTRNCDWWFTDEAVFLDTAGRYTTQDSDPDADSAAWSEFLTLLRKYRKRRPVNGVVLTISAQDLMTQTAASREAHVVAARRRLTELNNDLKIQLPVYVMVTKCDLVSGFTEYFDDLPQEGRAQVWGVTFPYEQTASGEAPRALPAEFDALVTRLNALVFARLEEERDVRRRAKVFGFPQQMAALREALCEFVAEAFGSTRFDQRVLLRGVYFTSGTQEGTPIDRLLGAIGRRFGVTADAVLAPPGRGKAYFIERLLKHVLLSESGLAGVNRRLEVQKAAAQLGAYAAMILAAVLAVIVNSVSYRRNRTYLDEVGAELATLREVPPVPADQPLETALPRLDAVRAVADSAGRYEADTPFAMRWGLYQGSSFGNAATDAYVRELDGALLPRVAARMKERLIEYAAEPEKVYEYLKAYLMLGQPEHLDKKHLGFIAELEWEAAYASDPATRTSITKHFRALLDSDERLRPIELDQTLVEQARNTIQRASIPGLMYRQIRVAYASDPREGVSLVKESGVGADRVLKRKSGVPFSDPVPSLYTKPVFEEITTRGTDELVKQFAQDRWVWGEGALSSLTASARIGPEMIEEYEKDYIATWDGILNDLDVVPFSGPETSQKLSILAQEKTSPLLLFLKVVDEHTFLVKPPDPSRPAGGVRDRLGSILKKGQTIIGVSTAAPGAKVTAHFDSIHRLVAAEGGGAPPIEGVLKQIGQIQQKLAPVGQAIGQKPLDPTTSREIAEIVRDIKQNPLPSPVASVVGRVGDRALAVSMADLGRGLTDRYRRELATSCDAAIDGRYPFTSGSTRDVALADFGRIFGHNGEFDAFFKAELAELVDTSRTPWRPRTGISGTSAGVPPSMIQRFEAAERVRDAFFRGGSQSPELRFTVTPVELDATATRFVLELDGQSFDYRHGPERNWPAVWPGPNPGTAAATFEVRAGGRPNVAFEGPWALFRLIDAGQVQRDTDLRFLLTLQAGGQQARVRFEATSVRNPFAQTGWRQFRCGI